MNIGNVVGAARTHPPTYRAPTGYRAPGRPMIHRMNTWRAVRSTTWKATPSCLQDLRRAPRTRKSTDSVLSPSAAARALSLSIRVSVDHHAQGQACHVTAPSSCYAASSASPQVVGSRPGGTELVTFRFAVYPKAKLLDVINFLEPTLTRERDLGCINSGHVNSNKHAI